MSRHTFRPPDEGSGWPLSVVLGAFFAVTLFIVMALAQMMSTVDPPEREIDEQLMAYSAPEVEEIEDEPPPPEEEEEPPPEQLEEEPPQLSLDQLDIALNVGTGGSLAGDFAMPTIGTSQRDLGTEDFVDFSDLDQIPRPQGASLDFPRRLKRKKVSGTITLLVKLESDGRVLDVSIDSSNLPDFDRFVLNEVKRWRFTQPTKQGQPVRAMARLPIPINIR